MATINCEGDPKIFDTGDGVELSIIGGQPEMDDGLENAVFLSLFTSPGWWGNILSEPAEKSASRLETALRRTLTNQTRLDVEQYAREALAWMVAEGIAKKITVSATIPEVGLCLVIIKIDQPDRVDTIRYNINWATMAARVGAL